MLIFYCKRLKSIFIIVDLEEKKTRIKNTVSKRKCERDGETSATPIIVDIFETEIKEFYELIQSTRMFNE